MDNQVEEIKRKLNIVDVINRYVPLKKRGRHWLACCPFHGEKTPSFTVSEELQIYKCFGCGKAGDVYTFLQEYEKIDFREALETLAKMAGVTLAKSENYTQEETRHRLLLEINNEVSKFYHYILISHPLGKKALDYVLGRGITISTIKQFKIGFSPQNSQLISRYLFKKGYKLSDLIATGTFGQSRFRLNELYDRFQDRLIFPLFDYRDQILGFSGRILPTSTNPNLAKYINSPETELYHKSYQVYGLNFAKDFIRQNNSVIVVEGEFDMISPFQSGFKNIVAIKGTAFTPEQLQLLRRYTDTLILALDSDFAGNNAARKSIELADQLEFDIKVLTLGGKYKDPDEAIKADPEFFKFQLQKTIPVWDFIINSVVGFNDFSTIKGKQKILADVLPFLLNIHNSVIKADYLNKLANEIGSKVESILEEYQKYTSTKRDDLVNQFKTETPAPEKISKIEKYEENLLTLIFAAQKPAKLAQKLKKHLSNFLTPKFKTIANILLQEVDFDPQIYQNHLPSELCQIFQNIYLNGTSLNLNAPERLRQIQKTINQIETIKIKEKINNLTKVIAQLESSGNETDLESTETEYNQLLQKLSRLQVQKQP